MSNDDARIRILSLDPSSTCIGYAEMAGERAEASDYSGVAVELVSAGRITPIKQVASYGDAKQLAARYGYEALATAPVVKGRLAANDRIESMLADLFDLVLELHPQAIVIEDTSGKVSRRHGGAGAGLAVYGKAVGAVWRTAVDMSVADARNRIAMGLLAATGEAAAVVMVPENEWTGGIGKRRRAMRIAAEFPGYRIEQDPGGDAADAIGLGRWWLARRWPHSPPRHEGAKEAKT